MNKTSEEIVLECISLSKILHEESLVCKNHAIKYHELFQKNQSQFWRRMYIRSLFAYVDATLYGFKKLLLCVYEEGELSLEELAIILEKSYEVKDNGKAVSKPTFVSLEKNIKFTFLTLIKFFSIEEAKPFSNNGWNSFKKSIEKRNLLTHPKQLNHLEISNEQMNQIEEGTSWFHKNIVTLYRGIAKSMQIQLGLDDSNSNNK
jgi:hypothetical protein